MPDDHGTFLTSLDIPSDIFIHTWSPEPVLQKGEGPSSPWVAGAQRNGWIPRLGNRSRQLGSPVEQVQWWWPSQSYHPEIIELD